MGRVVPNFPLNDRPQLDRVESKIDGIANETHCGLMMTPKCPVKRKMEEKGPKCESGEKEGE
jgi:hypothetical protein